MRSAALDRKNRTIVEAKTMEELIKKADKTGEDYIISPVLKEGDSVIGPLIFRDV